MQCLLLLRGLLFFCTESRSCPTYCCTFACACMSICTPIMCLRDNCGNHEPRLLNVLLVNKQPNVWGRKGRGREKQCSTTRVAATCLDPALAIPRFRSSSRIQNWKHRVEHCRDNTCVRASSCAHWGPGLRDFVSVLRFSEESRSPGDMLNLGACVAIFTHKTTGNNIHMTAMRKCRSWESPCVLLLEIELLPI